MTADVAPATLHNLLRATASEPWEQWYDGTRLVLADYLEERGAPGDDMAASLVRREMPVARWELALGPDESLYNLRVRLLPPGQVSVRLEMRQEGAVAFVPMKTVSVCGTGRHELGFWDHFRGISSRAEALALSCTLWPRQTLQASLSALTNSGETVGPWVSTECAHTLTGTDAARACRRRVLALFPGERVSGPCPRCGGRGECLRRNDWAPDSDRNPYFMAGCDYCAGRGTVPWLAPDLLPEKEPTT